MSDDDAPEVEPTSTDDAAPEPTDDEERHHVPVDSDEHERIPEPTMDMPDPEDEDVLEPVEGYEPSEPMGAPDDPSDEHPLLLTDPSDEVTPLPEGAPSELQQAYECLQIHTPLEEFMTFADARRETLVKLGETERAQVAGAALELGLAALREVMGAVPAPRKEAR